MTGLQENDVVRRARMGDRRAFESLYRMHFARIHEAVATRTRNRDDVDDLVRRMDEDCYNARFMLAGSTPPPDKGRTAFNP